MDARSWLIIAVLWLGAMAWFQYRARRNPDLVRYDRDLIAGGLLFLLTAGFFWRTISGDVYQPADGGDLVSFLFPTYRFAARELSQWQLPLWNPHLYGGAPFIADIQAGFLYLPNLLIFMLRPLFPYVTMQGLVIGHLYWAGLGTYVLLRTLRFNSEPVSRPAALFAALAFQFSDPLLIHLGNLNLIAVLSWLPWILAAYSQALERRSLRWALLAAFLFALANYAGHAQSSAYIGLALIIYTLGRLVVDLVQGSFERSPGKVAKFCWDRLQYAFLILLLAGLLTAPILLPVLELAGFSERSEFTYQDTIAFSLAPTQAAIGLVTPGFFGRGPALHWSLWARVETPYAGVATFIFAIAGLLLVGRERRRSLWPWVLLGLFGLLAALGVYTVVHGWLTLLVPGFDQFRAPARAIVLWTLSVSVLAGVGLDQIAAYGAGRLPPSGWGERGGRSALRRVLLLGAILLTLLATPLIYLSLIVTESDPANFLHASVAALAVVFATLFWIGTWALYGARTAGWFGAAPFVVAALALLFVDLSATGAYTDISSSDPTRGYQHPEIVDFLQSDPDLFRIDARTDIDTLWQPDSAALHGLFDVWGVANPLTLSHWSALWEATGGRQTRLYDMLNVKYVLVRDGTPLPEGKFELALDAAGDLSLYRNTGFMPRAWLVHDLRETPVGTFEDANLADLFAATDLEPATMALIEVEAGMAPVVAPAVGGEEVSIEGYESGMMTLKVTASAPALLLLSEVWYPGWTASVNGRDVPLYRANGALRALPVAAGDSLVQLQFAPTSWRMGLLGLAAGLILAAIVFLLGAHISSRRDVAG